MAKVLYISYDGMTDPLGQSQVLPYLAALSTQGYEFTILSFEKKSRFAKEKPVIEDVAKKTGIQWVPLIYTRTPPVLSKIYDRWKLRRTAFRLFKQQRFDMIHCRSYVAAEVGLGLKKKYDTKFLFDMRGFWPDEKVDSGQWNMKSTVFRKVYQHYKKKEKEFLLGADGIISLTRTAKAELLSQQQYSKLQVDVIPCCADLDHFNYQHINNGFVLGLREQLGIPAQKKVITYLGSVGGWYMTKEMFAFFKRLTTQYPEFVMLVLTKDDPGLIQRQATEAGIAPEKIITRYAGRNELPDYISLSDCSIFFIRPTYSKIASSPTKHAELMGMGIPVICNDIGDTGSIIEETKTGLVVKEFTDAEYDRVIAQMDGLLAIPKEHIRKAAFQYFDLEKGAGDYLQIYKRILKDQVCPA
jgi:glycosyltransferase involved in cell wall biosynthesis